MHRYRYTSILYRKKYRPYRPRTGQFRAIPASTGRTGRHRNHADYQPENRPSPSLVPLPFHLIDESIKKQLPITEYGDLLKRRGANCSAEGLVCVVCLNNMEASDGVRELCNCSHVFHKECLDVWIGQGQVTCPLCRSKLSPSQKMVPGLGGDPWRLERLSYLFGDDYDMITF
ncbi:hypothetical protein ACJW30_12G028000 [Castanea mollissima]